MVTHVITHVPSLVAALCPTWAAHGAQCRLAPGHTGAHVTHSGEYRWLTRDDARRMRYARAVEGTRR